MLPFFLMMNRTITQRRMNNTNKDIKNNKTDENASEIETKYCRTCFGTENLEDIFSKKGTAHKRSQDFYSICGLDIKPGDGLPQKICQQCSEMLHSAIQFRKLSRKTEKKLIDMAFAKESSPEDYTSPTLKKSVKTEKIKLEIAFQEYNDLYGDECDIDYDDDVKADDNPETYPAKRRRETIPNASSYRCNTCHKEFRMKATYKAHMRFHTNYCVCESCGKRCRNNNQLQEHKRARHGLGRIHKCAYCEYSSATKEALVIHERRHTGERPYVCDHCGATFHRRSNLVQHIAIHLSEKNFQCDMCPKRLKSRKFLQIHKHNAHTGKRYGYLCPVCDHRFEKPNKVRAHTRRVHGLTDEQQGPICPICFKWEKSRKLLQVHNYKRHQEPRYRYVCPVCKESFARPGNVRQHLIRAHNVPRERQGIIEKYEKCAMAE